MAMQLVAEVQDTEVSLATGPPRPGVGWMVQPLRFHRSAMVYWTPLANEVPTAMQLPADQQDALLR
jgi:hypothetical protein